MTPSLPCLETPSPFIAYEPHFSGPLFSCLPLHSLRTWDTPLLWASSFFFSSHTCPLLPPCLLSLPQRAMKKAQSGRSGSFRALGLGWGTPMTALKGLNQREKPYNKMWGLQHCSSFLLLYQLWGLQKNPTSASLPSTFSPLALLPFLPCLTSSSSLSNSLISFSRTGSPRPWPSRPVGDTDELTMLSGQRDLSYILIPKVPQRGCSLLLSLGVFSGFQGSKSSVGMQDIKHIYYFFITYVAFKLLLPFLFLHDPCCMNYLDFK